ncbi:cathepsin L [Trichonephila inaurata madagascariensis]|uniref:Cathepsin L n=1 Tax=Trichonephila inaurata madagascariensis TaxID=2747483 RepID=A0A8X6YP78_9ARAC|nr:cathepsin L [Trichonephila inaurata madagascariensis]
MKFLATFVCLIVAVASVSLPSNPEMDVFWESFKKAHNKSYTPQEERIRRLIWEENVIDIIRHNLQANQGLYSYKRGINKYCDLTEKEFTEKLTGLKVPKNLNITGSQWLPPTNVVVPDEIDWRKKGYVSEVKDQEDCGSCWAFSSTGALEGQHKKKSGKLVSLSEQNLIDCSRPEGNQGCDGGWMDQAFSYVKINHGIDTEASYPYVSQQQDCQFNKSGVGAICTGFVDLPSGNEEALKIALATIGPISVAVNADGGFKTYQSGIYDPDDCPGDYDYLDHGVLVVGYGTENGKDYWLIKNSCVGKIKINAGKNEDRYFIANFYDCGLVQVYHDYGVRIRSFLAKV